MTLEDAAYGAEPAVALGEPTPSITLGWQPRPWWTWTLALLALGTIALLGAAAQVTEATLGTSLRARSCDASAAPGIALLALGALLLALGFQASRLRFSGAVLSWDLGSLALSTPIPASLLVATLPGVFGCQLATDIAQIGLIGGTLVGQGGIVLAAGSAALLGIAFASAAHVSWLAASGMRTEEPPGIVEQAMIDAEVLERDASATRFRGVEPGGD